MAILSCFFSQGHSQGHSHGHGHQTGLGRLRTFPQPTFSGLSILISKAVGLKYQTEWVPQCLNAAEWKNAEVHFQEVITARK